MDELLRDSVWVRQEHRPAPDDDPTTEWWADMADKAEEDASTVPCERCDRGWYVDSNGKHWTCGFCRGWGVVPKESR